MFLISCSESKMLLKSLSNYQAPLEYLHDSKIKNCDKSKKIDILQIENQAFDASTSVSKINHKFYPFIIYNYEEINLAVKLGQNSLEQDYSSFFKNALTIESKRTGCFSLTNYAIEPEYTVEITFENCKVNSKYQRNTTTIFLLLIYTMSFQEIGFPAETDLVLNVKFNKGKDLIFEKKYSIEKTQPFLNVQRRDVNKLRSDFVMNMAESLSLSTKECIEQIIKDLNQAIEKQ